MSKLSFDVFQERVKTIISTNLLSTISGGTENDCHPPTRKRRVKTVVE